MSPRIRILAALLACGALGIFNTSCASAASADACGSGAIVDTYYGDPGDPYFGGAGGGDGVWNDPGYYDPGYGGAVSSGDDSSYGDGSGGAVDNSPSSGGDGSGAATGDDSSGSSGDDSSGDDSSGDDSSDAKRRLHLHAQDVPISSTPPDANGCYVCTVACTMAGGGGQPAGQAAQGVSSVSEAEACRAAMQTLEATGQSLGQCQANGAAPPAGRAAAQPTVQATPAPPPATGAPPRLAAGPARGGEELP
jgi:hypothetical protein